MNQRDLKKIVAKCGRFSNTNQWCGYLTPTEIIALIDAGAKPGLGWDSMLERVRLNKKTGISNPIWFYFYPNGIKMVDSVKKH